MAPNYVDMSLYLEDKRLPFVIRYPSWKLPFSIEKIIKRHKCIFTWRETTPAALRNLIIGVICFQTSNSGK